MTIIKSIWFNPICVSNNARTAGYAVSALTVIDIPMKLNEISLIKCCKILNRILFSHAASICEYC